MSTPQLPLPLRFPPSRRFESFQGADDAVRALEAFAAAPQGVALFLSGPAHSGKSHLLLACGARADAAGLRAVYLPLAALAGHLAAAIEDAERADLICIDALEAVAGRREDEVALFDLHNRARAAGAGLLYAARATPAGLGLGLPDLRSRLAQCIQLGIGALDEAGRRALLRRHAAARGFQIEDIALDYLFARVGRDLPGLLDLLERIDRESLAAQRRITVPFLRGLLG